METQEVENGGEIIEEEPETEEEVLEEEQGEFSEAEEQEVEPSEESEEELKGEAQQEVNEQGEVGEAQGQAEAQETEKKKPQIAIFKAIIDVKTLKPLVSAIHSVLNADAVLQVTRDGIKLRQMDSTKTVMVDLYLSRMDFYDFDVDQEGLLYLNLDDLEEVLARAKRGNNITLKVSDNKLNFIIEGAVTKRFTFPIEEPEITEIPDLNLKFTAGVSIDPSELANALQDAKLFADTVRLEADKDKFVLSSGMDQKDVTITFADPSIVELKVESPTKASYRLTELEKFIDKVKPLFNRVTLEFGERVPLKVTGRTTDAELQLVLYLAPVVE
ncbi:MAG: hypothetical protein JHC26_11905 [Thermofilum sp.]|jgi:proliferating cell nuclear antigen|uniref:hypothetical protein n=1 Tax=Thermofilum sp. TaxID=1961369 RepID=UPI002583E149|nr:hypothetical protein [Thermofilum sp.]MCI4409788.1 hypothetical protein [Thermofilum sp.]